MQAMQKPRSFAGPGEFRAWLEEHHAGATELLVRCFKTQAGDRGLTYRQALDEALCMGWIDGVRREPRTRSASPCASRRGRRGAPGAHVNAARVGELRAEGRMHAAGLAAFAARVETSYSYETRPRELAPPS